MIPRFVTGVLLTVTLGDMPKDVSEAVAHIKTLLTEGRLDAAEANYQKLLETSPQGPEVKELRTQFALANARAGRHLRAADHLAATILDQVALLNEEGQAAARVTRLAEGLLASYRQAERLDAAEQPFDTILAAVAELAEDGAEPRHAVLTRDLRAMRATAIAAGGRGQDARQELKTLLQSARVDFAAQDNVPNILHLAHLLRRQWEITTVSAPREEPAARREFLDFLADQSARFPTDGVLLRAYFDAYRNVADDLATSDPDAAEAVAKEAQERFRSLSTADPLTRNRAQFALRQFAAVEAKIRIERSHRALKSKPAKPPVVRRWLNTEPIEWERLQGRVVMLCFWSLASRGSLQALPQVADWHEEFSEKGLSVLGVTRHANIGWDAEKRQPRRGDPRMPLTNDEQDEALRQFCAQSGIEFPVGIVERTSATYTDYGVVAVPLVVLIDRAGRVRRLGLLTSSGAREIERQIRQLLGEPANAAPR